MHCRLTRQAVLDALITAVECRVGAAELHTSALPGR
jgi:adenosylcobinamide amidohydrolase